MHHTHTTPLSPPLALPLLPLDPPPPIPAQGKLEAAVEAYEQAAAAAPNLAVVQLNLAVALTERGTQLKNAGGRVYGSMPHALHAT